MTVNYNLYDYNQHMMRGAVACGAHNGWIQVIDWLAKCLLNIVNNELASSRPEPLSAYLHRTKAG